MTKQNNSSVTLSYDLNHRPIGFEVIELDSGKNGPTLCMQASVHGAELQGNLVIQKFLEAIQAKEWIGKIICIPFANPWGTSHLLGAGTYGRFDAITGKNWNRAYHNLMDAEKFENFAKNFAADSPSLASEFRKLLAQILEEQISQKKSYGLARAENLTYELQKISLHADIFLDLHTAPYAGLYLYAPDFLKEKSKDLSFPTNLIIPPEFAGAGDEAHFAPWAQLEKYYQKQNQKFSIPIESYTLELGGEELVCGQQATAQVQHIMQLLQRRGMILKDKPLKLPIGKFQNLEHFKTYYAPFAGLCEYLVKPGQEVSAGEPLAKITYYNYETASFNSLPVNAKSPSLVVNHFSTSNVQAGSEIYQLLENPLNY